MGRSYGQEREASHIAPAQVGADSWSGGVMGAFSMQGISASELLCNSSVNEMGVS